MKGTFVKELAKVELKNPIMIERLPGLGLVGKIAARYLIKQLKAQKFAYLYSPHFPYFVLVSKREALGLCGAPFISGKTKREKTTDYIHRRQPSPDD